MALPNETKPPRKLRVQGRSRLIDWLILAAHIRKIAHKDPFFSSLLEGLVSKLRDRPYRAGRSRDWMKNRRHPARHAVQKYTRAMLLQFQLGVACNALHPVEARMARWLLQLRDRIDHDVLPLTQQALLQMLGVRRKTVTLLMRNLRARGDQV
jgi:CRP-like cAMP-binding protein